MKSIGLIGLGFLFVSSVWAQTCDPNCSNAIECKDKIAKCQEAWNQMETAKLPHVSALRKMEAEIAAFQARIKSIEGDLAKKAAAITRGEREIAGFLELASHRIRKLYIQSLFHNPLAILFSTGDIGAILRTMVYQQQLLNDNKKSMTLTAVSVKDIEGKKSVLENEKA